VPSGIGLRCFRAFAHVVDGGQCLLRERL
jgi:hypothetical protein